MMKTHPNVWAIVLHALTRMMRIKIKIERAQLLLVTGWFGASVDLGEA